ncbi:hypothetical protein HDU81_001209 [Chytriomyces hyalinus]|nr:hypothetical protein HDU81_001209 [Chytriomyces hyalinus]
MLLMDTKRTSTRPKPSTTTATTTATTSTARKSTAVKPATPQSARSTTTPTPTATAKKPGPTATTSTTAKKASSGKVSTPVPASAKSAAAAASKKVLTETVMADASTDTLDLETVTAAAVEESGKEMPDNGVDADESPAQTIARLSAQVATLTESETTLKDALDARDIEFYMLRSEYDTHLASAESKQSSFASELNSESVFDTLQAENQALQRRISAMKREMDEAVDAVKTEMSSKESELQNDLQTNLEARDTEIATLQSNNAAQTAQLQSLLQELTQLKESNHAKDFELARSARDYLALQHQISRASMVEAAKLDELEFARESLESARARIRELEGHLESSLNELKQVRLDLLAFAKAEQVEVAEAAEAAKFAANPDADLFQKLQQLQDARQKDTEHLALLEARVVELSQERDSLVAEVEAVKVALNEPVEPASTESNEQDLENLKRLETIVVDLTQERDTLAALVATKTTEAREASDRAIAAEESLVTAQMSTKDSASSDSAELQADIEALRKQSEQDKEAALQAALSSFESEKAVLLAEISELKTKHEQSVAELQQSLESNASANLSSDHTTGSVDVSALQGRLEAMQAELISVQDESTLQMTQFTQEKAALLQQIENLTTELAMISTTSEQQTSMLKETLIAQFESDRNVAIAAAVAEIESEKANLEEKVCKLEATHLQERTTLDTLQTGDIDELAKRATAAESRVEALMAERAELLAAVEEREQLQNVEQGDSQQVLLLQNEIDALRAAHEAEIAVLKALQTSTPVTETPAVPNSDIETLQSNLQQVTLDAESAKQRVIHLEHLQAQIMNQFETTQSESQELKTSLYKKVSLISDMESRIEILSSDLEDARMQLASLSSTHTQLVEQHGDLQTSQIDQDVAAMSLADQELAAARQELQAAAAQTEQLGSQLQSANEKLLNETARVATLQRQLDLMAGVNKTDRSDSFMATRRLALDPTISVENRLLAFEKLVAEMEVQLVAKARSPPLSAGILRSPVPSVGQLRIVNDEDD